MDPNYVLAPSASFWDYLTHLVAVSRLIIDRPRKSSHPIYPGIIYPLDYGYLEGTTTIDGCGVDIWLGTSGSQKISGVLMTVDLHKRDTELKILLGCTEEEMQMILNFQNNQAMRALLVRRPTM